MIFLAALEYAILASTFTIGKIAVNLCDPLFLIGVRMICAAPLLLLFQKLQKNSMLNIKKEHWQKFFLVGIFHIFLPFVSEFWALQYVSSSKTAMIYSLTPFIAAILSFFLHKVRLSIQQVLGLIIGLSGLFPIFLAGGDLAQVAGEFLYISLPEIVLLGSVISASFAWFLVSDLMKEGYGIGLINGVAMFLGGAMSLILWLSLAGGVWPIKGEISEFIFWTSLLILVANVISYNFYGWLLSHISITLMSAIGFLCPIFASIYGWYFLDEQIGIPHFVGLLLVILGLWLFYRSEIQKKMVGKLSYEEQQS